MAPAAVAPPAPAAATAQAGISPLDPNVIRGDMKPTAPVAGIRPNKAPTAVQPPPVARSRLAVCLMACRISAATPEGLTDEFH
jgi:hypothetical protein